MTELHQHALSENQMVEGELFSHLTGDHEVALDKIKGLSKKELEDFHIVIHTTQVETLGEFEPLPLESESTWVGNTMIPTARNGTFYADVIEFTGFNPDELNEAWYFDVAGIQARAVEHLQLSEKLGVAE